MERLQPYDKIAAYDDLCHSIGRYSASIESRQIAWDSLTEAYGTRITNTMSEQAYFDTLSTLLRYFRDPHVWLIAPERSMYTIDHLGYTQNVERQLLRDNYLERIVDHSGSIFSGFASEQVGYLFCADFKGDVPKTEELFDQVFERFRHTSGLIIDLRLNDGGNVYIAQYLLGKLTTDRQLWHTSQNRTFRGFDEPYEWYMEPGSLEQYTGKVVLLTGRYTISAGERFAMGATLLDQVQIMGDTTANTQGSVMGREMLNGWKYTLTFEKVLDPNGVNYAGKGVPPDVYVPADKTIIDGKDILLEKALEVLH